MVVEKKFNIENFCFLTKYSHALVAKLSTKTKILFKVLWGVINFLI